jgi:RNA polymerase sigma factor (sigma-70 family)
MNRTSATRHAAEAQQRQAAERLEDAFTRHQDELLGMLYYFLGNAEDARDVFQETFVKCWRHRREVADVENLRAWVFRIALNTARDARTTAWRRRRRPLEEGGATLELGDPGPETEAVRREQLALVRRALRRLRPEEQEVFLLRQNGQMTYGEIAQAINVPLGTVKTRMRLAIAKLRESLESK